ncbi:hypothetical protein EW145_g3903 [Phellinidium pouzarii]|uniref:Translationally-controlled tumor protein homolog n=1 Tax=Phellinidium pouzarii TaxID=167371 RepID=A0A4V3XCQ3_9AGAM|nr:hypothetical protein EW145_g3903 [Phellinidium pouzarii]
MLVFKDIVSDDEMFSDAFFYKEVDDIVYEVDCAMVTIKPGEDVDIGANPSAEEQEEAVEDGSIQVNNIVHSFRLQPTTFDKKSFVSYLKGYMKAVKTKIAETEPDRVDPFEKGAQNFAKKIIANFKDYEFYTGESMNADGMVALLNYREDGITQNELLPPSIIILTPFKANAGVFFWSLINATLGAHIALTIFTRLNPYVSSSRIQLALRNNSELTFVSFEPGFVVLSLCVPTTLIIGAFVILDLRCALGLLKSGLCGLIVGLSVGFMHYALYLSFPAFDAVFSTMQVSLSLLLCTSVSVFFFLSILFCQLKGKRWMWMRLLVALVYGCAVAGADYLSLDGTSFLVNVIPALTSIALTCLTVLLTVLEWTGQQRSSLPKLVIASISFASDSRVLVNEKGMLPTRAVNLDGLPKNILDELDIRCNTFHWLLSLSRDWEILTPFSPYIARNPSSDTHLFPWRFFRSISSCLQCCTKSNIPLSPRAILKLRIIEASAQLAEDLGLTPEWLGTLHDAALEMGTRIDITEFLLLSKHATDELQNLERSLKNDGPPGRMLFFVRKLPHHPASLVSADKAICDEYNWSQKYAERGYRLLFMRRFRDTLAQMTGAAHADVDRVLLGCKDDTVSGTRPILEADEMYVSLFSERCAEDGSTEVLVYSFAKHQIPSYRLDVQGITSQIRDWLREMAGLSASELIKLCKTDVARFHGCTPLPFSQDYAHEFELLLMRNLSIDKDEAALLKFKLALLSALEQLMRDLAFVGQGLRDLARLSPYVIDVPSIASIDGGSPAHLIILRSSAPGQNPAEDPYPDSDFTRVSSSNTGHVISQRLSRVGIMPMPSVFVYTPHALFDVAHALVCSAPARDAFRLQTALELERLLQLGPSTNSCTEGESGLREPFQRLQAPALVSSFSIDTVSDADDERPSRARAVVARARAGWMMLARKVRLVRTQSRPGIRRTSNSTMASSVTLTSPTAAERRASFYPGAQSTMELGRVDGSPESYCASQWKPFAGAKSEAATKGFPSRSSRVSRPPPLASTKYFF